MNSLLRDIGNMALIFFPFWNNKQSVSNKIINKNKLISCNYNYFFFVIHNCVHCTTMIRFI